MQADWIYSQIFQQIVAPVPPAVRLTVNYYTVDVEHCTQSLYTLSTAPSYHWPPAQTALGDHALAYGPRRRPHSPVGRASDAYEAHGLHVSKTFMVMKTFTRHTV